GLLARAAAAVLAAAALLLGAGALVLLAGAGGLDAGALGFAAAVLGEGAGCRSGARFGATGLAAAFLAGRLGDTASRRRIGLGDGRGLNGLDDARGTVVELDLEGPCVAIARAAIVMVAVVRHCRGIDRIGRWRVLGGRGRRNVADRVFIILRAGQA